MEEYTLDYYFSDTKEFAFAPVFNNVTYPWEALQQVKSFIEDTVVKQNIQENKATMGEFVSITGNYSIGENTVIGANVSIEGPVLIGKNCTIQAGALIRPYSIIGDDCVVGHGCEVKHSIVQNKAKVQSLTFIGNSLIGKSTRVGSGTILANRRFDQKNITVKTKDTIVDVGSNYFGAVIGDNTRIGANCTTIPGSFIGPYTWILPSIQIRGFVPKGKRIFPVQNTTMVENEIIELK